MGRTFISYSRRDAAFARQLASSLSESGMDVWIDVEDIPAGMKWSSAIQQGLDNAEVMLVVISPDSMASNNVEDEWQYFVDHQKPIIPIFLRPAKVHFQLNRIQYIDFLNQPYETALAELYSEFARLGIDMDEQTSQIPPTPAAQIPLQQPFQQAPTPDITAPAHPDLEQRPVSDLSGAAPVAPEQAPVPEIRPPEQPVTAPAPMPERSSGRSQTEQEPPAQKASASTMQTAPMAGLSMQMMPSRALPTPQPSQSRGLLIAVTAGIAVIGLLILGYVFSLMNPQAELADNYTPIAQNTQIPLGYAGNPVTRNNDWTLQAGSGATAGMMLIPAGSFMMGADQSNLNEGLSHCPSGINCNNLFADEKPQTRISFDQPFWIDRSEYAEEGSNLPRVNVTWAEALELCEAQGKRLPTEAEWEYAARGPDALIYPWGNTYDGTRLNVCDQSCEFNWRNSSYNDGYATRAPLGSFPGGASWVGALDMSGSVWEWTSSLYSSLYHNYPYNSDDGREDLSHSGTRTLRGSSWNWIGAEARTTARAAPIQPATDYYGFRCARDFQP